MRAFVTVAEELHFGRAAMRLGVSQPQVSRQVRALEECLAVELFTRTPRRTELTDAGHALLGEVREALSAVDRVHRLAARVRRGVGGRVNVGFVWSTLNGYVSPLVAGVAERLDGIELGISQLTFLEVLPAVRRGDVDLVISRAVFAEHELSELTLTTEPSLLAMPEAHPLAEQDKVAAEQLDALDMIAFHRDQVPSAYDAALRRAGDAGIELRIVAHARSATEALALVSAGVGVYRIPATAAPAFPGVVYRELDGLPSQVVLIHRPFPSEAARAVIALTRALFSDADSASNDSPRSLPTQPASS